MKKEYPVNRRPDRPPVHPGQILKDESIPDPISQISLAVPIILLYEISIHMARLVERKRAAAQAELDDEAE